MHYAVTVAGGVTISGPPPSDVFVTPTRFWILQYLTDELDDARRGPAYSVLNACRAWRFLETGDLVSKVAGANWAMARVDDGELIVRALEQQNGHAVAIVADEASRRFVSSVIARIAAADPPR